MRSRAGLEASSLALVALAGVAGCARHGVVTDGTSVSFGGSSDGALLGAVRLPAAGDGFWIPPRWASRGLNYGTDELVTLIARAARRVELERPGSRLGVADLSPRTGGRSAWHRSHQTGRDADLLFFAVDAAGRSVEVTSMDRYLADGTLAPATGPDGKPLPARFFDVERNWLLVRALIEDPSADVQYLFIYAPLRDRLLAHAAAAGEPPGLVARAAALLRQPGDSAPHDDHLHVRIFCPASDRSLGCLDRGLLRWKKKGYKYEPLLGRRPAIATTELTASIHGAISLARLSLHGLGSFTLLLAEAAPPE